MKKYLIVFAALAMVFASCTNETSKYTKISFKYSEIEIAEGMSQSLIVLYEPTTLDAPTCTWSSSNEQVVTVDQKGTITGVAQGNATITAKVGDLSAACQVTVKSIYDLIEWNGMAWWTAVEDNPTPLTNDTLEVKITYKGSPLLVHCIPAKVYARVWGDGLYMDDKGEKLTGSGVDAFCEGMGLVITEDLGKGQNGYILGSDIIQFVDPSVFNWNDTTFLFCCPAGKTTGTAVQHYSYLTGASDTPATEGAEIQLYDADAESGKKVLDGLIGFMNPGIWYGDEEAVLLAKAEVNWFTFASEETPSYYGMLLEQTAEGWDFAEPKTWAPQVKSQYIFDNREVDGAPHYKLIPVQREIPDYVKNRTIPTDVLIKK